MTQNLEEWRGTNAKDEFIKHIKGKGRLVCARIGKYAGYSDTYDWKILPDNYTQEQFDKFCEEINFTYEGRELYGLILFENSYSDRREDDCSVWWENHKMPTIKQVININL